MSKLASWEVFGMTKRDLEIFLAECEPYLPIGLSTNEKKNLPVSWGFSVTRFDYTGA